MLKRLLLLLFLSAPAAAAPPEAQTILHLLDYIGVDYPEAVSDGKVKNEDEYKEMLEFTAQVSRRVAALPENAAGAGLLEQARSLEKLVRDKSAPPGVAAASGELRWAIVAAYQLRIAPRSAPDLSRGKALYAQHCAACHGTEGRGDGPAAKGLDPAPSSFHELERMAQRSVYGLYNTITLGVEGTAMGSFRQLSEDERWALAFHVANTGVPAARAASGRSLWESGRFARIFPDLAPVATLSTREAQAKLGREAASVQDYLRAHPEVLRRSPIAHTREKIAEALQAYRAGERAAARDAAIQGYLEGFELAEAALANVDAALMRDIERRMLGLRSAIERAAPAADVERLASEVDALLAGAQEKLAAGGLSWTAAFTASFVILLREGLEAMLVLAAILAFVAKSGRRDALPWVHGGWIAALGLGAVTWMAATFLLEISGANRELTEGVTGIIAAALLLYVGYWLHGKAYVQAWNRFLREHVSRALEQRTLWAMAAVSFLAVYREIFESVLFYQALWAQAGSAGQGAVLGGMAAAAVALVAAGLLLFRYAVRLPIGPFFGGTSVLLAALAVVFAGHGVAALQEAGALALHAFDFEPLPLLGIYPSAEALGAQVLAVLLAALGFRAARRQAAATP